MQATAVILLTLLATSFSKSYNNYKVYQVTSENEAHYQYLNKLQKNENFDFWTKINKVGLPVTIMASPDIQDTFEKLLKLNGINFKILIENVERTIEAERFALNKKVAREGRSITFDQYYSHSEINDYLDNLAESYPDLTTVEALGQSYENRTIKLIKISSGPRNPPKPVIFIDAGIHAREWIAPAVALYLINQLVENPSNLNLLENADWTIAPCLNPDGYEYTRKEDRFWRKTRSPGRRCIGCDPNRNFGFHWMESGASSNECSDIYAGAEAFSEKETRALRDYLAKTELNIKAYLTLHSASQMLLYPWGYIDKLCDNWKELDNLGNAMADAIRAVSGTYYIVGGSTETLYAAAGASDDWAMGEAAIDIVYTMELPGGGSQGFDLPPEEIQGVVEETFEGLKVFGDYVANNR